MAKMTKLLSIIGLLFIFHSQTHAALGRVIEQRPSHSDPTVNYEVAFSLTEFFTNALAYVFWIIAIFIVLMLLYKLMRLAFELYYSRNLRYLKITLPRADSKLDKEKETKKDFKEKIGMMSMFYKAIHKLSEAGLKDTFLNFLFGHSKVSLELVYEDGEVTFFIVTYQNYVNLVSQHITSIYNDAEIEVIDKSSYINFDQPGYSMRAASLGKEHDDVFPIKSFKYLEDDPINNFTNVFGGLRKDDKAVYQVVIKPVNSKWNQKALKAARMVAKGKYKKNKKFGMLGILFRPFSILWNPIVAMIQGPDNMV